MGEPGVYPFGCTNLKISPGRLRYRYSTVQYKPQDISRETQVPVQYSTVQYSTVQFASTLVQYIISKLNTLKNGDIFQIIEQIKIPL